VSYFSTLQILKFTSCPNITDVSCLGNLRELSFIYCLGITDVSSLGRVYNLELSNCKNIRDVSALGNVHILNLNGSFGITDVSVLKNVYELHLEYFTGNSLAGLENVVKLFLTGTYDAISDISMLKAVKELYVSFCPLINDFHGLNNLQDLEVGCCDYTAVPFKISSGLEIFENLLELRARWVDFFEGVRDYDTPDVFLSLCDVPKVRTLNLSECVFSHFPASFSHLLSLTLRDCSGFSVLPGIPSLDSLEVTSCERLTELHLSGNGEKYPICKVKIQFCDRLKILRLSRSISQLRIARCPKLSRVAIERQVNFLRVSYCPKLRGFSQSAPIICSDWEMGSEEDEGESEEEEEDDDNDDNDENEGEDEDEDENVVQDDNDEDLEENSDDEGDIDDNDEEDEEK
jgi:hypothetical protein